jgi:hypothetical protein
MESAPALFLVPEEDDDFDFQVADPDTKFLASLVRVRERLVEKAEDLSIALEHQLDPQPALRLSGTERDKARHLYMSQARKIEAELNKLATLAEKFRVHIY